MPLIQIELPSPKQMRAGWAANAALVAAKGKGWELNAVATEDHWHYHDGGGNWVSLKFKDKNKAILIGMDHEYSRTYFRESAAYFGEKETDLLKDAPDWWDSELSTIIGEIRFEPWIGFIYGWDGSVWKRAEYDLDDGFTSVGLLRTFTNESLLELVAAVTDRALDRSLAPALQDMIDADTQITLALLENVAPGLDAAAGVAAAKKFALAPISEVGN